MNIWAYRTIVNTKKLVLPRPCMCDVCLWTCPGYPVLMLVENGHIGRGLIWERASGPLVLYYLQLHGGRCFYEWSIFLYAVYVLLCFIEKKRKNCVGQIRCGAHFFCIFLHVHATFKFQVYFFFLHIKRFLFEHYLFRFFIETD